MNQKWFLKPVHISWLIAGTSLGIISGATLAPYIGYNYASAIWLLIACPILVTSLLGRRKYFMILAVLAGLIFGLHRASIEGAALEQYKSYYGKQLQLSGRVNDDTSYGPQGNQRMRLDKIRIDGHEMHATVWVSFDSNIEIKRGDYVVISGTLTEGFGNIPASVYRADILAVERPYPGDIGRRVRDWFGEGVKLTMTQSDTNFALAFLLSQKLPLADGLDEQLRTIGLIHAIVASGFHLTILVTAVRRLTVSVSKYLTVLLSGAMIGGFILITGFSPSMTRAGIVTGLALLAWYYGRVVHPVVLLSFTAALTVLYKPQYAWGDVGWLLSFAAFAGVIILAPLLNSYFWGKKRPGVLREIVLATVAAQLFTLPITMYVFGYFSAYAILANILVVPVIPFIMLLTFITGIFGLLFLPLGMLFGTITSHLLQYVNFVVNWIYGLPRSKTEIDITMIWVVLSYIFIIGLTTLLWKVTKYNFKNPPDMYKVF